MYNLCVFTCIIFIFVFQCTRANVICIKLLLTYLLTKSTELLTGYGKAPVYNITFNGGIILLKVRIGISSQTE